MALALLAIDVAMMLYASGFAFKNHFLSAKFQGNCQMVRQLHEVIIHALDQHVPRALLAGVLVADKRTGRKDLTHPLFT